MADYSTAQVNELLRKRYAEDGHNKWVQVWEAANQSWGHHRRKKRSCDMVAIGAWESLDGIIIGHEVKVSRSDWLKEVDQPEKSDAFAPYCDKWYIVAAPNIVNKDELRASWGLMEVARGGKSIKIRKQAEANADKKPLTERMMILWMRNIQQSIEYDIKQRVQVATADEVEREMERHRRNSTEGRWEKRAADLDSKIKEFEQASGIDIADEWNLGNVGELVKMLRWSTLSQLADTYARTADTLQKSAKRLEEQVEELRFLASEE